MVNAKTKVSPKSSIIVKNTDSCYCRKYCLSQNTFAKMQIKYLTVQKSKLEEFRLKNLKPANKKTLALHYINKSRNTFC